METRTYNIRNMPAETWDRLKVVAIRKKVSVREAIEQALTQYIEKEERKWQSSNKPL